MSRRQLDIALLPILFAVSLLMITCVVTLVTSEAAQEPLVNCNEALFEDRCACNERLLDALAQMKRIVPDPQFAHAGEANAAIVIQQHRQYRLLTYYAPTCWKKLSPKDLPASEQRKGGWLSQAAIEKHLKPLHTEDIAEKEIQSARNLLVGRWQGWQTFFDSKPTPVSLYVISVGNPRPLNQPQDAPFIKACSDQGSVFGRLRDGYLELPRSDAFGAVYAIRLWRSTVRRSRDLEGVVLLETRPGEVVVAGLISLSRTVKFDWTTPPSNYFCQDRDLEEERKNAEEVKRALPWPPWPLKDWYLEYR
jgi:hypothetical protein